MTTQKMLSVLRKGVEKYKMIKAGDKIAVGISGGKDSITLFKLLAEYRRFSPEPFELMGISVDLGFNGKRGDFSRIKELADGYGVPYIVEETDIAEVVFNVRKEKSPCALCSKMRKGALYDAAKREGCNKAALGHHSDDLTDTFLLSLFYEGRLSAFAPKSYLDRTGITLIRPMIMLREADIISYSKGFIIFINSSSFNILLVFSFFLLKYIFLGNLFFSYFFINSFVNSRYLSQIHFEG